MSMPFVMEGEDYFGRWWGEVYNIGQFSTVSQYIRKAGILGTVISTVPIQIYFYFPVKDSTLPNIVIDIPANTLVDLSRVESHVFPDGTQSLSDWNLYLYVEADEPFTATFNLSDGQALLSTDYYS